MVAAVSTLVWVVISRAGSGIEPLTQPQADVTGSLPVPVDERPPARTSPGVTLSPRPAPTTGSTATPPPSSPSTTPVVVVPQRRSWSGAAGHLVAECDGATVRLVTVFPNAGWRYAIGSEGPATADVRFSRSGEDRSVIVSAQCVSGAPQFLTPSAGGGDD